MYRQKIHDNYSELSPSYRKVADFVMSRYYDVVFMTAAQLAEAVGVDTTTVVRFSQRLGYDGYPELLQDIRAQVREELYAVYEPAAIDKNDPAAVFKARLDQESANLRQIVIHNPPGRLQAIAGGLAAAQRILFVAEGPLGAMAQVVIAQLRQQGIVADALPAEPMSQAEALAQLTGEEVLVGISGEEDGVVLARSLAFARNRGCQTYGVAARLNQPVSRAVDGLLYVPSENAGFHSSVVALTGALTALAEAVAALRPGAAPLNPEEMRAAYRALTE